MSVLYEVLRSQSNHAETATASFIFCVIHRPEIN